MLEVKNISKTYKTGDLKQVALDGVSLCFRDNEFVSILGPSGSGKTTLLNIIGGLDRYDKGDLIINNISTKKYKNKDWDSYRNHTVGFVFQSYNLIPHQTILSNVELALTISGISRKERKERALKALDEVGLKEQAHKKPNQMSGGQMQRVAVARALVNNPDILLADEPTGALDSETSLQVMDLLKKIAKDRLVVMVTHNPELAEEYSTRIVKLKDGKIINDSNPFKKSEKEKPHKYKNLGKSSMSLLTAFSLSLNNLLTKKGRTILTSFAGSIGIIGIALILSLSNGFQAYIDKVQEDTLTSYPLTIQKETTDPTQMFLSTMTNTTDKKSKNKDSVVESKNLENMLSTIGKNDMKSFKKYIEQENETVSKLATEVTYGYGITPNIYTRDINNKITQINPSSLFQGLMGGQTRMSIFQELSPNEKMIKDSYTLIKGNFPKKYDEMIIVLPDENHISDILLYSLGLKDSTNVDKMISKIMAGERVEKTNDEREVSFDELMNLKIKLVLPTDKYRYNADYNLYEDMSEDTAFMENLYNNSVDLKIVGIAKMKESNGMSAFLSGVGYSPELSKYVIDQTKDKEIVKKQLANKEVNVFSGKRFDDKSQNSGMNFDDLISIDTNMLSSAFNINIDQAYISNITSGYMEEINNAITADTTDAKNMFLSSFSTITKNLLNNYIETHQTELMPGVATISSGDVNEIVENYLNNDYTAGVLQPMEDKYTIPKEAYTATYKEIIKTFLNMYIALGGGDSAMISSNAVDTMVDTLVTTNGIPEMADEFSKKMVEATMQKTILTKVGELTGELMGQMATAFNVDQNKIAGAFKFNLTEDDIKRIFSAMSTTNSQTDANTNLLSLGYQELDSPSTISFYFKDFASKEKFIKFLNSYNKKMKKIDKEKVIEYTDLTGVMISSVKIIVDSVSYVLIAFVSVSLIVSSIMIGIITYISVLERTKEIGILRAIGASKRNISSIFNAETMIIGFLSGLIGVGVSLILLVPINAIIHTLTKNNDITAILPMTASIVLIILSTILTLIGGLIPSRKAAKQDPVLALRSE